MTIAKVINSVTLSLPASFIVIALFGLSLRVSEPTPRAKRRGSNLKSILRHLEVPTLLCAFVPLCLCAFPGAFSPAYSNEVQFKTSSGISLIVNSDEVDYNYASEQIFIPGNANIEFGSSSITSKNLSIDLKKEILETSADVRIAKDNIVLDGTSLFYSYKTNSGILRKPKTCLNGVNITGDELTISVDKYKINNAFSTTCNISLDYFVTAKDIEIIPNKKLIFRKPTLSIFRHKVITIPKYITYIKKNNGGPFVVSDETEAKNKTKISFSFLSPKYSGDKGLELGGGVLYRATKENDIRLRWNYYSDFQGATQLELHKHTKCGFLIANFWQEEGRECNSGNEKNNNNESKSVLNSALIFKYGKELKESTGYFSYAPPTVVWNEPQLEYRVSNLHTIQTANFSKLLAPAELSFEVGKSRERLIPLNTRVFVKATKQIPIEFLHYLGNSFYYFNDARAAIYTNYKKYYVFANGIGWQKGEEKLSANFLNLRFMLFLHKGNTLFRSDVVDTDNKIYVDTRRRMLGKLFAGINSQYNLKKNRFDEIEYGILRMTDCTKVEFSWKSVRNKFSFRYRIIKF